MTGIPGISKKRIFLVDDHALVREGLADLINQRPDLMICGEADCPHDAMNGIATSQPDLAIVEPMLKNTLALELIKDLKRLHPNVAVLVFSMHDESLYAERALRSGASGYIMKREPTGKIIDAIYRILEGKIYIGDILGKIVTSRYLEEASTETGAAVQRLSDRELGVFRLLGQGHESSEIAAVLQISVKAARSHCRRIQEKLGLDSSRKLLCEAIHWYGASKTR